MINLKSAAPVQQGMIAKGGIAVFGAIALFAALPGFQANPVSFAMIMMALVAAIAILASYAGPLTEHSLPAWLCVSLLLCAYVLKVVLVAPNPDSAVHMGMLPRVVYGDVPVQEVLYDAMLLSVLCCTPLCIVYSFLLARADANRHRMEKSVDPLSVPVLLLIISALGSVLSAWLTTRYQIGLMGIQVTEVLPFRLRGIIYYFRVYALPGMLLYSIYSAYRNRAAGWVIVGIILLLGNGVFDSAVKASRSALLLPVLSLFFLFVVAGYRFRLRHAMVVAVILLPIMVALPYIGQIRQFRQQGEGLVSALAHVLSASDADPLSSLFIGIKFVLYRIPGYDLMVGILGHGMTPLGMAAFDVFRSERGVAGYLTVEGFLFAPDLPHLSAPGFVGWWFLVGGWPLVATGGGIVAFVVHFAWQGLSALTCPSRVVLQVFFLLLFFVALTEGTLDSLGKPLIAMLASAIFLEIVVRLARRLTGADAET